MRPASMPLPASGPGPGPRAAPDLAFIRCHLRLLPGAPQRFPYVLARFQRALFAPGLFSQHGVIVPDSIRMSAPSRQAEFLAGRVCAQAILQTHGLGANVVGIGAHRQPLWPAGVVGSITHAHQYAAAVACAGAGLLGIGIDIESIVGAEAREALATIVVSEREIACLHQAGGTLDVATLLTLVFSAKESFFKAAFEQVGRYIEFDALELFHVDLAARMLHFRCAHTLSAHLPRGRVCEARFVFLEDAVLTVVALGREDAAMPGHGLAVNIDSDLSGRNAVK